MDEEGLSRSRTDREISSIHLQEAEIIPLILDQVNTCVGKVAVIPPSLSFFIEFTDALALCGHLQHLVQAFYFRTLRSLPLLAFKGS